MTNKNIIPQVIRQTSKFSWKNHYKWEITSSYYVNSSWANHLEILATSKPYDIQRMFKLLYSCVYFTC